eukprot:Anaeramoba_flamelloidesa89910_34.p1 GENE.a89910_34~~a89910_34.p1  ORF type:complete len:311 (-),score=43.86 a89910_34:472-1404(-)
MKRILLGALLALGLLAGGGAQATEPLVSPEWLAGHLNDGSVKVLDIRNRIDGGSAAVFAEGHIPGAVYSNYLSDGWRVARDGVPGMLPPVADLERLIGGLGIGNGDHVVVVPAGVSALDYGSATRVYWTFKVLGHDAVSILDGGYAGWTADAAREVETGSSDPAAVAFKADFQPQLLAGRSDVQDALANGTTLIDNRPRAQFLGAAKHGKAARYGTIPGAVNLPQERFFNAASGRFAGRDQLETLWHEGLIDEQKDQITFCNTGHWASLGWFASYALLGNHKARLYDGSMTEWSSDPALPMLNTDNPNRK